MDTNQLHLIAFLMDQNLREENQALRDRVQSLMFQVELLSDQLSERNRVVAQLQSDFDQVWTMYVDIERERDRLRAAPPEEEDPLETAFRLGEETESDGYESEDLMELLLRTDSRRCR